MKARPTHELLATIGEYTDTKTGEKKKRRTKIATIFTSPEGYQSVKFETMPVGPDWTGWASIFPIREREDRKPSQPDAGRYESARAMAESAGSAIDDDIPF